MTLRGTPQIHDFALKLDENPALLEPQYGEYRVVAPKGVSLETLTVTATQIWLSQIVAI